MSTCANGTSVCWESDAQLVSQGAELAAWCGDRVEGQSTGGRLRQAASKPFGCALPRHLAVTVALVGALSCLWPLPF